MKVLSWGLISFGASFLIHLVIWKIRIPKRQTRALLFIFSGVMLLEITALALKAALLTSIGFPVPDSPYEYLHILILGASLALAYITTYSAMEVDSPSLVIARLIAAAGKEGIAKDDLMGCLTDDVLVKPRIKDLLRDDLACLTDGRYKITRKGEVLAGVFMFYRRLLNITEEGG